MLYWSNIDKEWTTDSEIAFVVTFAHELRHVWQFFNAPVALYGVIPLSWVMSDQQTPSELDAEGFAREIADTIFGRSVVTDHLTQRIATCPPEHRETWMRLEASGRYPCEQLEPDTIALLEQHALEIVHYQKRHNFEIPGVRRLTELAGSKLRVRLVVPRHS